MPRTPVFLLLLLASASARADVAPTPEFYDDCQGHAPGTCCHRELPGLVVDPDTGVEHRADAGFGVCRTRPATCADVGVVRALGSRLGGCALAAILGSDAGCPDAGPPPPPEPETFLVDGRACCLPGEPRPDGGSSCRRWLPEPIAYCDASEPGATACAPRPKSRFSCGAATPAALGPWLLALLVPLLVRGRR